MNALVFLLATMLSGSPVPQNGQYGPDGEIKVINQAYVNCSGRTYVQAKNAMDDLMHADTDSEVDHAIRVNKCSFVDLSADQRIRQVLDLRCTYGAGHRCKDEYYLFEVENPAGQRYYAIFSPWSD